MPVKKLQFSENAKKKPVLVDAKGRFLTIADVEANPTLRRASLHALPPEAQIKLTVQRYTAEPDFKLAIIGSGIMTRDEILRNIQQQTPFGKLAVQVEMEACNQVLAALPGVEAVPWPKPPKLPVEKEPYWKPVRNFLQVKLQNRALFCENTTDSVTAPAAQRRIATVHPAFAARGFDVHSLEGANDVRVKFVPEAKWFLTCYESGIGHGSYTCYTGYAAPGQGMDHILEVGHYDPSEVKGRAFHFLSCETAGQLGPDVVAKGGRCYAGYSENFTFVWDDSNTPVNEFLLFMDADAIFDIMMANGATAQQAYNAVIQAFNNAMLQVPGTAAYSWLIYDRDHLKLLGDPAATIKPYTYIRIRFPVTELERQEALVHAGELVSQP